VSAVGDRDIGGRRFQELVFDGHRNQNRQNVWDQIDRSTRLITDRCDRYVDRIGQNLVRNSDCKRRSRSR